MPAATSLALLIFQEGRPSGPPLNLVYLIYLLIIGAGLGAAAQRTILRRSSLWSAMFIGIIGAAVGGYLGIAVLGYRDIALSGGFVGPIVALAIGAIVKRSSPASEVATNVPRINTAPSVTPDFAAPKPAPRPVADPPPRSAPTSSQSSSGDIFISYASSDRSFAQRLARALQDEGWSVWWDRAIPPGKTFDAVIEEALDAAKCVVVLWSGILRDLRLGQSRGRGGRPSSDSDSRPDRRRHDSSRVSVASRRQVWWTGPVQPIIPASRAW